jgi:transposase InsO family protein
MGTRKYFELRQDRESIVERNHSYAARGFVYLAAVMGWFSGRVMSWRMSVTIEVDFCLDAVDEAIARHGSPEILDTDQGSQGGFKWSSQQELIDLSGGCPKSSTRRRACNCDSC